MKVLSITVSYPNKRRIGAELYNHQLHQALIANGVEVDVIASDMLGETWEYDGITVNSPLQKEYDLILTNVSLRQKAWYYKRMLKLNVPIIGIQHNFSPSVITDESLYLWEGLIYNSSYMLEESTNNYAQKQVLIPPCVSPVGKKLTKGKAVTLIGLTEFKGVELFNALINTLPNVEFIGVEGGWGINAPLAESPNYQAYAHTDDLTPIYQATSLLLVPSMSESWAMVASEAMAYGCHVLTYADLYGVLENIGDTGYIIGREDSLAVVSAKVVELLQLETSKDLAARKKNQLQAKKNNIKHVKQLSETVSFIKSFINIDEA